MGGCEGRMQREMEARKRWEGDAAHEGETKKSLKEEKRVLEDKFGGVEGDVGA